MKMRQLKQYHVEQTRLQVFLQRILAQGAGASSFLQQFQKTSLQYLADTATDPVVHEVEAAKQEFVVVKKSTGEVVGTFDTEGPAVEMIERARKQKKAALQLL